MWRTVATILHKRARQLRCVPAATASLSSKCPATSAAPSQAAPGVPYEKSMHESKPTSGAPLPRQADVVVIGGGVTGCSVLYHLAKYGVGNVVLLEKDQVTAGTTWHTAGLLWRLRANETEFHLTNKTWQLMQTLEKETGVHPGWINNGGIFMAATKERLDEYRRLMVFGKVFGIESKILTPEETKQVYPLINVENICGALHSPTDGNINPAEYCTALLRGATQRGAKVALGCQVEGIETYADDFGTTRIKAVHTNQGTITTTAVVNCAGVWAPYISEMVGVKIPQYSFKHAYVVTQPIKGISSMPSIRDHDLSIYLKTQGDSLAIGGYEPHPVIMDEGVERSFSFGLYDLDWDVFSVHVEAAAQRVPKVAEVGIKSTVCGPESFTPDGRPLMGENPDVRGFFHSHGFNSGGMMMSGGSGESLAQWVVNGRPDLAMFYYDVRRFNPKLIGNRKWLRERSHEMYAKHYSIEFHSDEPLGGRNAIKDVLYDKLLKKGCIYQQRGGWERPGYFEKDVIAPALPYDYYGSYGLKAHPSYPYSDLLKREYTFDFPSHHKLIGQECKTCRESVAIFNMSYFGKFYLTGPDAKAAVDWIFTNNIDKPSGSTVYTCILNHNGGTEADLTVSVIGSDRLGPELQFGVQGPSYYVAVGGAFSPHVLAYMRSVIEDKKLKVAINDLSESMVLLSVQGPQSRNVLQKLTDVELSNEKFPFSTHQVVNIAGHKARFMRLSFVGELGWEIHAPNGSALKIYEAVMEAGKKYGIANAGYRAMDCLSIEKGYRHWHADVRSDDSPLEAGLAFTCKLKSATPFLGRAALESQQKSGLTKRLACFTIDEHVALHDREAIIRNGSAVGYIRRAEFGFTIGKTIAYGYVSNNGSPVTNDFLKSGSYILDRMGTQYKAQYHARSPFDPDHKRIAGHYEG